MNKIPFTGVVAVNEKGFTLIELIMVIVLLGILAAVAIPKYQDLRTEAAVASCQGVYGAVQGAAAVNFATRLVSQSKATSITNGTTLVASLQGGAPEGWTVNAAGTNPALSVTIGSTNCQIAITTPQTDNTMAAFTKTGF